LTVNKDEFAEFKIEVFKRMDNLQSKIDFIIDPQKGLYLSVHDNGKKVKDATELINDLQKKVAELEKYDQSVEKFKTQIITAFFVIQTVAGAIFAVLSFWKG